MNDQDTGTGHVRLATVGRLFTLSALLLLASTVCRFSEAAAQIETAAFPIVQLDESARVASLGGRSPALTTDESAAIFSNPALLSTSARDHLSFSYLNHIGNTSAGWISYARGLDSLTTIAAGIRYLSFGSIDRADSRGQRDGTFSASDVAFSVGASRILRDRLQYGANATLMLGSIDGAHASAIALDAGIHYSDVSGMTSIGLSILNAGGVLSSFGNRRDRVPFDIRLGVTRRLAHMPLLLSITAYRLQKLDGGPDDATALENVFYHLILGGEFQFSKSFQIRFGYNHRRHDELKTKTRLDLAGFSTGVGIRVRRIGIDYSFNSWSSLGGLHRFSVRTGI